MSVRGGGEFLSAVRHAGADVIANDISGEACEFLERKLHIPVVRGELAESCWKLGPPDVIVMNDLIEHAVEPSRLISCAASLLRQGGRLMIWTPNGGGAGQEAKTAESWVGFRVDLEHFQYFSPRTIQVLAGTWGLHIDHLETRGYPQLQGIDELPSNNNASRLSLVEMTKTLVKIHAPWISHARQIVYEMRRPHMIGNYSVFAILKKP